MSEIPLPSGFQIVMSPYGYFLPLMLYAAWSTLAFWDIARRTTLSRGAAIGWMLVVMLVPFVGALAYHLAGGSEIPKSLRAAVVGGGLAIFGLALLVGRLAGGAA